MKKNFKWLLALVAMVASVNLMAATKTSTLTFTAACNGSGTADDKVAWTVTSDAAESTYDDTKGIHYGTGSKAVSYLTLTSAAFDNNITKVVVNCSDANKTAMTSVTVGGKAFGTSQKEDAYNNTAYTFEPTQEQGANFTGAVVVTMSRTSAKKALYVKSIVVTYDDGQGADPVLQSIAISGTPKTAYEKGESFDVTGLTVTGTYDKGDPQDLTVDAEWEITPATFTSTSQTSVSVTAKVGEKSDTKNYNVTVTEFVQTYANTYTSDASLSSLITGSKVKWEGCKVEDGYAALKIAKAGTATITVPAGTKTVHLHMVAWNGESADVAVKLGETTLPSIKPTADAGVSGTSTTYTIATEPKTENSYYFAIEVNATEETTLSLTTGSSKRAILFGVNFEADTKPSISADVEKIEFEQKELSGTVTDSKVISATGKNLTAAISASMKEGSDAIFSVTPVGTPTAAAGEFTVSYSTTEAGEYAGTVVLKSGETSIEIPVSASVVTHIPVLQSIYVQGEPTKKEYTVGDAFETDGLEVWGKYDEGADKQITEGIEWEVTPATFSATTETSVSVVATALEKISEAFVVNGLTVNEAPKVIGNWNTLFETSYNGSITGLKGQNDLVLEGTTDFGVTVKVENHASANGYIKDQDLRLYTNNNGDYTFTVTAPTGKVFKQIVATKADKVIAVKEKDEKGTISVGTSGAMTWTGKANSLVFIPTATTGFGTMTFVIAESAPSAATPTITPSTEAEIYWEPITVTLACETEGAAIYYTTNGDAPTAASTLYEAPFQVSATTTVKAIAVKEGLDNSEVASKTFSFGKVFDNIAACLADETLQNEDVVKISNVSAVITSFAGSGKTVYFEGGSFYVNATHPQTYAIGGTLSGSNLQFTYMNYNPKQLRPASWETLTYTAPGSPTGVNNMNANKKATKVIVNGQIVIVRDGKAYNVLGF